MAPHHTDLGGDASVRVSRPYAWVVFAMTFGLLLSDYMSRQVLNAVFPSLKSDWGLSDTQLGSLGGIVALMVGLLTFPLSLVADRLGRVKSLTIMAGLWSLATLGCGLAQSYGQMAAARLFVGVGEAAYGSVGVAVAVSVFPPSLRATITSAFMAGGVFGSVIGVALGGIIAQSLGWRWSFAVMALLGMALAAVFPLVVRESAVEGRLRRKQPAALPSGAELVALVRELFTSPALLLTYAASGLQLLVAGAVLAWAPSLLNRAYHLPQAQAALGAAGLSLVCGVGMIGCGRLVDRLGKVRRGWKPLLAAGYGLATVVLLSLAFSLPAGAAQIALLAGGLIFAAGSTGPAGAIAANLTRPAIHGTAFATLTLANNLLGLAPGPMLMGVLADQIGLVSAFRVVSLAAAPAAVLFWLCARRYKAELAAGGAQPSGAAITASKAETAA